MGEWSKELIDPEAPSQQEINEHFIRGHLPYRNWCPVCVQAQGRDDDHKRDQGKERRLPEYSFDYCFPGDEFGYKWSVLVVLFRYGGSYKRDLRRHFCG